MSNFQNSDQIGSGQPQGFYGFEAYKSPEEVDIFISAAEYVGGIAVTQFEVSDELTARSIAENVRSSLQQNLFGRAHDTQANVGTVETITKSILKGASEGKNRAVALSTADISRMIPFWREVERIKTDRAAQNQTDK